MNAIMVSKTTGGNRPGTDRTRGFELRRSRSLGRLAVSLLLNLALTAACCATQLQAQSIDEYQVKIAFLYNFSKFVAWPPETFTNDKGQLTLGVVGDDPFGKTIDQFMSGKTVSGRKVTIKRLKWGQNLKECHILFISASEQKRLSQIVESLKGASILTIGEMQQFTQHGGMINLVLEEDKIRFEVNLNAAVQANLKISSKLLALAKSITGEQSLGRD